MESLGYKLMDSIRDVGELEISIMRLESALFRKKLDDAIKNGVALMENSITSKAMVYDVELNEYSKRVEKAKSEYFIQVNKLKEEYELQFVNSQLELREVLESQKKAISRAKRALNEKYEKNDNRYDQVKDELIDKYYGYDSIAKVCEEKINNCLKEALDEVNKIVKENVSTSIAIKDEKILKKVFSKIRNIIYGKLKFENELKKVEENINFLSKNSDSKIKLIRKNTIEFVCQIATERENLSAQMV